MSDSAPALVFVGFMGAGKSSAARAAAEAAGSRPLDSDRLVEERLGHTIAEHFEAAGEASFRAVEEEVVVELLERARGEQPIALGGGSLGSARVRAALERHTVVLLDIDAQTAWTRAQSRKRPLADDRAAFEALHRTRAAVYEQAADAIVPGYRETVARALPALQRLRAAPANTRLLWAPSLAAPESEYPVFVGRGLLARPPLPSPHGVRHAVSDEHVWPLHATPALHDGRAPLPLIPPGESSKTLAGAQRLWVELAARGATRADELIALGGGVVGDLAGFVAACYQRGIGVIQVPTTLVAQVDSAYGGKTGVDLPAAKNYVGAYHQPAAVIADLATLDTLPAAELAAGWAEVIKTALIAGGELWRRVAAGEPEGEWTVTGCARVKLAIVASDERDDGARQLLNLGHTVAHAIESVTRYERYRHGEAVALGLLAALRLSGSGDLREQVAGLLAARGLPVTLDEDVEAEAVVAATRLDKKRVGERVPFVLCEAPGEVRSGQTVDEAAVLAAVRELHAGGAATVAGRAS